MRFPYPQMAWLFLIGFAACTKRSGSPPAALPAVNITGISQNRSTGNSVFHFSLSVSQAAAASLTVNYKTVAGTALENTDYLPASGTLTIPAGSTTAGIDVTVTGDSLRKENQTFYIQLSNPVNCTLAGSQATGIIVNENGLYFPVDSAGYSTPASYPGYQLVWSDEFEGNQVNPNNWTFEQGNNNGWGNAELEYYTNSSNNAFVSDGHLILEARHESTGGFQYSSARMKTQGLRSFTYGRVDIRARLPKGQGIWPALWMLGSNIGSVGWPACGEIDIMELLGQTPGKVYGTLHWGSSPATHQSSGSSYTLASGSFDQQFHVFSLLWQQDSIKIFVDDQAYFSIPRTQISPPNPFDSSFFFIFNIAVGGNWPGSPDNNTVFPQRMIVDYIRVFQ